VRELEGAGVGVEMRAKNTKRENMIKFPSQYRQERERQRR
jgi:hypothetical protein